MSTVALDLENMLPVTLTLPDLSEAEFLRICAQFPDDMVEYSAGDQAVIIMPPTDSRTSGRNFRINGQLFIWHERTPHGLATDATGGFRLPNGSRRAPDAAWFNRDRWEKAAASGDRYPVFAPEFVIELRSPDDRIRPLREKMEEYIQNGVQLGWLIDPKERTVTIYRPGQQPEVLNAPSEVRGEGPIDGFVLNLAGILD